MVHVTNNGHVRHGYDTSNKLHDLPTQMSVPQVLIAVSGLDGEIFTVPVTFILIVPCVIA